MSGAFSLVVPVILCLVALYALQKRCDVYSSLYDGAYDGLKIVVKIPVSYTHLDVYKRQGA